MQDLLVKGQFMTDEYYASKTGKLTQLQYYQMKKLVCDLRTETIIED